MTRPTHRSRFFVQPLKLFADIHDQCHLMKQNKSPEGCGLCSLTRSRDLPPTRVESSRVLSNRRGVLWRSVQSGRAERRWDGSRGLAPQNQRIWSTLCISVSGGVYILSHLCGEGGGLFFISFSLTTCYCQHIEILGEHDDDHHFSRNEPWCQKQFQVKEAEKPQWRNKRSGMRTSLSASQRLVCVCFKAVRYLILARCWHGEGFFWI